MRLIDTLGRFWSGLAADWRVTEDYHTAAHRDADPQPIRSLEFRREGDSHWHGAECWREETGRALPIRVARWALDHGVNARSLEAGVP